MIRFILVILILVVILLIVRSRSVKIKKSSVLKNKYKFIIIAIVILGVLFLIATSGRYILPQILQLIKMGLPFITKLIGI